MQMPCCIIKMMARKLFQFEDLLKKVKPESKRMLTWARITGMIDTHCFLVRMGIREMAELGFNCSERDNELKQLILKRIKAQGCKVMVRKFRNRESQPIWMFYLYLAPRGHRLALRAYALTASGRRDAHYHKELGRLFGYSQEAISNFIKSLTRR
jgi:hypothetical protein